MARIVNPNLPEEYKYETDYRNIPSKYLNKDIPKGRCMIKWQPFASVPEQYDIINQHIKNQEKIEKPILDEIALNDLNRVLTEKIKYWIDRYYKKIECEIYKFDNTKSILKVKKDEATIAINSDCIVDIE